MITSGKALAALVGAGLILLGSRRSSAATSSSAGAEYITDPERVSRMQRALSEMGYSTGFGSGTVDVPTLAALNQFLQDLQRPAVAGITPSAYALVQQVYTLWLEELDRQGGSSSSTDGGAYTSQSPSPAPSTGTVGSSGPSVELDPLGGAVVTDRVTIANVQRWLSGLGYDPGTADGLVGRRTLAAVNQFLQDEGQAGGRTSITDAIVRLIRDAYGSGHLAGAPTVVGGATEDAEPLMDAQTGRAIAARNARIASVLAATRTRAQRGHRRY